MVHLFRGTVWCEVPNYVVFRNGLPKQNQEHQKQRPPSWLEHSVTLSQATRGFLSHD
jgi:hypothetical protein